MHRMQGRGAGAGGGIQFRTPAVGGGGGVDRSGTTSPPLWKSSPPPTSPRSLAIARGQRELMEMVQNMPESAYELSLRDIVELPKASNEGPAQERGFPGGGVGRQAPAGRRRKSGGGAEMRQESRGGGKRNGNRGVNGEFMLKMFFPPSFGMKKSRSGNGRVSPEKSVEGEWWKKKSSGESGKSGSTSSSNSSRNRSRHLDRFTPGCWPFFHSNKSKSKKG